MNKFIVVSASVLLINGCSSFSLESRCNSAWDSLNASGNSHYVKTLVKEDCAVLYKQGWLKSENNHRGTVNFAKCVPAWNNLFTEGYEREAKFLISNQCPVLYPNKVDQKAP